MSSDDPLESIATETTKAIIELSLEKIQNLVKKFKEKELAFIQERSIIDLVREQYNSGESKFYNRYIKDQELLLLVRLGLTFRKLEDNLERLNNLKQKVLRKYNVNGLHIAYFVQNGILNRYIGLIIEGIESEQDLEKKIENILKNIEKHTLFVTWQDKAEKIVQQTLIIVTSHNPVIFIVSGIGSASKIVRECSSTLEKIMKDYELENQTISGGKKEILFFKRILRKESN